MAKVTPAHIIYTPDGGEEQVINFHAVIGEDHQASAQVTKYPVQTGYQISNHSIRQNRLVTLEGVFSNVIFDSGNGTGTKDQYGADTNSIVFQVLEGLVNSGQEVKVVTNLGIYDPVVFTRFKTKQSAGKVDSMQFTLIGEEFIRVDASGTAAPATLSFVVVEGVERETAAAELEYLGYLVAPQDEISTTTHRADEDFVITGVDSASQPVETTYIFSGYDPVTGQPTYEVHVSEEAVAVASEVLPEVSVDQCAEEGFKDSLLGGVKQVSGCLVDEANDILLDALEDKIDTAMGELKKSIHGVFYDITQGSEIGASLLKAGIGCVVRTAISSPISNSEYQPSESLPTTDDIMTGALEGLGLTKTEPKVITLTQIQHSCVGDVPQDTATDLLPLPF